MRKSEKFVINYYNHPKFLTKVQKVFHLILKHHHKLVDHSGQGIALKKIRSLGYWIVDANSAAKNLVLKSYQCRKYRGTVWEQKLSNLPFFRLSGTSFLTYCGKDMFGPTVVKQKKVKRNVMASTVVYIQVVFRLYLFSLAGRGVIARRVNVCPFYSENGSNSLLQKWN